MTKKRATFARTFEHLQRAVAITVSDENTGEGLTAVMGEVAFDDAVIKFLRQRSHYVDFENTTLRIDFEPPDVCRLSITLRPEAVRLIVPLSPKALDELREALEPPAIMAEWAALPDKQPDDSDG